MFHFFVKCYKNALRPLECNVSDVRKIKLMSQKCHKNVNFFQTRLNKCVKNVQFLAEMLEKCYIFRQNVVKMSQNVQKMFNFLRIYGHFLKNN
jgi:hypothetical protein